MTNKTIYKKLSKLRQRGQGMTEYIIIVALIAVAGIAVFQFFGQTIRHQTAAIAEEVSGQKANQEGQKSATAAAAEGKKVKGLDDFSNDNARTGGGGGGGAPAQ
jgi:Flp pilus assembly pilin Flp